MVLGEFFGSKETVGKTSVIFDVGTTSVGVAIVDLSSSKPTILFYDRESLDIKDPNSQGYVEVLKTVNTLTEKVLYKFKKPPEQVYFFLSSHFILGQTRVVSLNKNGDKFSVTQKMIDSLIDDEVGQFNKENLLFLNSVAGNKNVVLDKKIMQFKCNGYEVKDPIGKEVKSLEIFLYFSISSVSLVDGLKDVSFRHFHDKNPDIHSFTFSAFSVLRDILVNVNSFLLVDIGSFATEVTLVKNDSLYQSISFPGGVKTFLNKFAQKINLSNADTRSHLNLYLTSKLDEQKSKIVKKEIDTLLDLWGSGFVNSLEKLSKDFLLPQTVFIFSHDDLSVLYSKYVEEMSIQRYFRLGKPAYVSLISEKYLNNFCGNKTNSKTDSIIMTEAIFVDKLK